MLQRHLKRLSNIRAYIQYVCSKASEYSSVHFTDVFVVVFKGPYSLLFLGYMRQ